MYIIALFFKWSLGLPTQRYIYHNYTDTCFFFPTEHNQHAEKTNRTLLASINFPLLILETQCWLSHTTSKVSIILTHRSFLEQITQVLSFYPNSYAVFLAITKYDLNTKPVYMLHTLPCLPFSSFP